MTRGTLSFHVGHAAANRVHHNKEKRAANATCATGGFITEPTPGQVVNSSSPVSFSWDSSCLNTTSADIYLYAPSEDQSLIQVFEGVSFAPGTYQATLKPKWWNSTASVDLQLNIVPAGTPAFMATLPAGPIWTVNYTPPPAGVPSDGSGNSSALDSNVTHVDNLSSKSGGLSKGAIAAAVIIPLIVVGLGLAIYIRFSRVREEARRKRWSEAVDKRMSTISVDWRAMSAQGAEAAIRASFAGPNRNSVRSSFVAGDGAPRPSSTFAAEGSPSDDGSQPQMAQIRRPGVGPRGPMASGAASERMSRVSFAADTRFSRMSTGDGLGSRGRPSLDSRRAGVPSRSFHSAYIPPVPLPSRRSEYTPDADQSASSDGDDSGSGALSPTQRNGPLALSAADIQARVNGVHSENAEPRPSLDEVMPALSMMRMQNGSQADLLLEPQQKPQPPPLETAALPPSPPPTVKSPIMEAMPMQPMPAAGMMSPDDMLRVYAERRRTNNSITTRSTTPGSPVISFPLPVAAVPGVNTSGGSNMRTLYTPGSAGEGVQIGSNNPFRKSMAGGTGEPQGRRSNETHYDNEDAYFGTAE